VVATLLYNYLWVTKNYKSIVKNFLAKYVNLIRPNYAKMFQTGDDSIFATRYCNVLDWLYRVQVSGTFMVHRLITDSPTWTVAPVTDTHTSSSHCTSSADTSSTLWTSFCPASCCPCSSWSASVCPPRRARRSPSGSLSCSPSPSSFSWSPTTYLARPQLYPSLVRMCQGQINSLEVDVGGEGEGGVLHDIGIQALHRNWRRFKLCGV